MAMFDREYIQFRAESQRRGRSGQELRAPGGDELRPPVRVSNDEWAIAQQFDGTRSLDAVLATVAADHPDLSREALCDFVAELARHGLMHSGRREPVPPLRQRDTRSARGRINPDRLWPSATAYPPPTVPGSLAQPGVLPTFLGHALPDDSRPVGVAAFLRVGGLLLWPLRHRATFIAALMLLGAAVYLVYTHRYDWLQYSILTMPGWRILLHIGLALWLINVLGAAAQAAAIHRYAGVRPLIYRQGGAWRIPLFVVDSAQVASHLGRRDRLRIVAASLVATAQLIVAGVVLWAMTAATLPSLASAVSIAATAATFSLVLRLNPLIAREGQQLLVNGLGIVDLQRQSFGALLGRRRPWNTQSRVVPRAWLVLYAVLTLVFALAFVVLAIWFVGGFFERRFQGAGVVLVLSVCGFLVFKQTSRNKAERTTLGEPPRSWWPRRRTLLVLAAIGAAGLIPYPYEPGGPFEILPMDRADARALVAGDVREVLVSEGDEVEPGETIVRLDDTLARARVESYEAQLAGVQADLALALKGAKSEEVEVARQRVKTAETAKQLAVSSFRRISQAYRSRSVTAETFDQARGAVEVATEELEEAQRALDLVQSPAEQEQIASLEADVQRIRAELVAAESDLASTRIGAPIAGRVVAPRLLFARGEYLDRGDLIATIEDTSQLLAEIRMPQAFVGEIAIDADVSAKLWAYPSVRFPGRVRSVAPNAEEDEYGPVVRIQVLFDSTDPRLKPGLTGNAKVAAGWEPAGLVFTRAIVRFVLVELWSWIP